MASVDLGTLRRHLGLWVWLTTCARGLADPLGRFCDTMRGGTWVAVGVVGRFGDTMRRVREVIAGRFGLGCRRSGLPFGSGCARWLGCSAPLGVWPLSTLGRSGDTRVRVTGSQMHLAGRARSGRSGDTCVGWLAAGTSVLFGLARDDFATPCDGCFTLKRGSDLGGTICRSHSSYRALQQSRGLVCEDPFAKGKGSDTEFI